MLTLTIGRTAFKICHKEGSRTTVWEVGSDVSEETLVQTFKDVIAFVEGAQAPPASPWPPEVLHDLGPVAHPDQVLPTSTVGNGWASVTPIVAPELPEDRQGKWELIKPGEDA